MLIERGTVRFPGIDQGQWIQGKVTALDCKGLVTLIDFWDYTCVNCIRTLPYTKEWHERYAHLGLLVVGVHTPEFDFGHNPQNVLRGVHVFDIPYPVVLDNQRKIWDAFANRSWPSRYLFDVRGYLRYQHPGERDYDGGERAIQSLLQERNGAGEFAGVMEPVRASDRPDAASYPCTPELHLGMQRGRIGNAATDPAPDGRHNFPLPAELYPGTVYLVGSWSSHPQYMRYVGESEGHILLHYTASEVNLVMRAPRSAAVHVMQDAKALRREDAGEDIRFEQAHAVVTVREPRMYQLVKNKTSGSHLLSLRTASSGLEAYAFSFVSCAS